MTNKELDDLVKALNKAIEAKAVVIENGALELKNKATKLQKALAKKFIELAENFEFVDGKIVLSTTNAITLNRIINAMGAEYVGGAVLMGNSLLSTLDAVNGAANNYYALMVDKVPNYSVRAKNKLAKKFGIKGSKLLDDGYLSQVMFSMDPINKLKTRALQGIAKGATRKEFMSDMLTTIQGRIDPNNPKPGIIEQHQTATELDLFYSQWERQYSNSIAEDADLNKGRYGGPIMTTSRNWCIIHVGHVLTREEYLTWNSKTWKGKNILGYDVFTDAGGYHCNHTIDWVTDIVGDYLELKYPPKNKKIP